MNVKFFKRAVKCLDATIGIVSNNKGLIRDKRFFQSPKMESLLTNIHKLPEVPYELSLIHISEPTRLRRISYAVF